MTMINAGVMLTPQMLLNTIMVDWTASPATRRSTTTSHAADQAGVERVRRNPALRQKQA